MSSERRLRALRDTEMIARQWDIPDPLFLMMRKSRLIIAAKWKRSVGFVELGTGKRKKLQQENIQRAAVTEL